MLRRWPWHGVMLGDYVGKRVARGSIFPQCFAGLPPLLADRVAWDMSGCWCVFATSGIQAGPGRGLVALLGVCGAAFSADVTGAMA
eukprot:CAMPEP_0204317934 /NCGR_PEP_ID=MMETSP0469-20131031/6248_1 /ASSEMBLY_ACC=CAM_ASM_000384 /TAXON_ID=2969 /ORGANISM="Oxyrrhis marina" /LENGTH=85 /DNA_ID=CAMNT_0051298909 /DNA_START=79 /DNA_END=334 /DNA_ORIENTATION=-